MHVYLVAYYLYTKVPSIYLCSLAGMLRSTTTSAKRVRPKPLLMIRETLSRRRRDQRFPKPRLSRLLLSVSEGHMTAHTIFSWNTVWPGHAVRGGILCTPDVPHVIALSLALSTCNWRCSVWFKTVYFMSICSLMLDPNPKWIAGVLRRMSCSWNFQPTWSTSLCGRHRKKGLEQLLWWVEILPCAEVPSSTRNCSQLDILYIALMITPYILWFTWHFTSAQPRQVDHQGTQSAHLPSGLARESGAQLISSASDPRVDQLAWPQPCETIPGWCKLQLCGSKLMVIKVKKYWKISQSNWDDGSKIVLTTPEFFVMVNPEGDINVRQKNQWWSD